MKFLASKKGSVLVLVALCMTFILGMLALSVDMGWILVTRNQLQNAADSAALAGGSQLGYFYGRTDSSELGAINLATDYATKHLGAERMVDDPDVEVEVAADASAFGVNASGAAIRVTVKRTEESTPVPLFFSQLFGQPSADVPAVAIARWTCVGGGPCGGGACGQRPWAIRDKEKNKWGSGGDWQTGDTVILKYSAQGEPRENEFWFSPIQFPPVNRPDCGSPVPGASAYRNLIINGTGCQDDECYYGAGDRFSIETGNMTGPTIQGIDEGGLIGKEVSAFFFLPNDYTCSTTQGGGTKCETTVSRVGCFKILNVVRTGNQRSSIVAQFQQSCLVKGQPGDEDCNPDCTYSLAYTLQLVK